MYGDNDPQPLRDQPSNEYDMVIVRLARLQSDMTALRDDVLALHAAVHDLQRRLRLIAGW